MEEKDVKKFIKIMKYHGYTDDEIAKIYERIINSKGKDKAINVRLPIRLFSWIADKPSRRVKEAILRLYGDFEWGKKK